MGNNTISVIIPTCGRPTLARAIESATSQFIHGDQLLIQRDQTGDWGNTARRNLIAGAKASWLAFMDDDDVFVPGIFSVIRKITTRRVPHIFRNEVKGELQWKEMVLEQGNVSSQCLIIPNETSKLGLWTNRYEADWDFALSTIELYGGKYEWRPEVIAVRRPTSLIYSAYEQPLDLLDDSK